MSARPPIVQYWHSPEPPQHIAELTGSFAERNPDRPHLLFDEVSADRFIVEHFGERESAAFRACGPPAMQADYFRYCAVLHFGGIWADAGFACTRNLDPLLEGAQSGELFSSFVSDYILMNGLFAFAAAQHPFLRLAVDLSTALIEMRWTGKVNEITGPLVLTSIYRLHRAGSVDAFLSELREHTPEPRLAHFTRYARLLCELIGGCDHARDACSGVRVSPAQRHRNWVSRPSQGLPHRSPENHWPSLGSDVYKTAPGDALAIDDSVTRKPDSGNCQAE